MTEKDNEDFKFAFSLRANWIALSFVRKAADVLELKSMVGFEASLYTKIIAKIEKPEAIENIDSIIEASDGIMVARGRPGYRSASRKSSFTTEGNRQKKQSKREASHRRYADDGEYDRTQFPNSSRDF